MKTASQNNVSGLPPRAVEVADLQRQVVRRPDYVPKFQQEQFMVPLLRRSIEKHLDGLLAGAFTTRQTVRVLDAGCGAQPFRDRIEKAGAIYRSMDAVEQADVDVDVISRIDVPELPAAAYDGGTYDLILCSEVLEHVAEWDHAFANFERLLSKEGHLILTCPHFYPLHEKPYDFWRPTPYAIPYFANKHGLLVETVEKLGTGWDILGTLLVKMRFRPNTNSIISRLIARLCTYLTGLLFVVLRSRIIQRFVEESGPYYLANCAVIRKDK